MAAEDALDAGQCAGLLKFLGEIDRLGGGIRLPYSSPWPVE
jgi:hypothetical protein